MSERSKRVRYQVEHDKIKFLSTSRHVIFCLLYKHTNGNFFDDFLKISEHFPKICEDSRKVVRRLDNYFRTFSENLRRLLKISKISEEEPMMFQS